MDGYRHRIMDGLLEKKLQAKGAVLIEGPKWCGKTTTAEEIAVSKVMLARTGVKNSFKSLLEIYTDMALVGHWWGIGGVLAEVLNGKVYHYRDKSGLECDASYTFIMGNRLGKNKTWRFVYHCLSFSFFISHAIFSPRLRMFAIPSSSFSTSPMSLP